MTEVKIGVNANVGQAEAGIKKVDAATAGLEKRLEGVSAAAKAAGDQVDRLVKLLSGATGRSIDDVSAVMAADRFTKLKRVAPGLRGYGGLDDFLSGPGAALHSQSASGRAYRERVIRSVLPPVADGAGAGGGAAPPLPSPRPGIGSGMMPSLGGMLMRGAGFGLGMLGIGGLASTMKAGLDHAMAENNSIDTAIRSAGAFGTSLESLRSITQKVGDQFGYLYTDTAKFAGVWAKAAGNLGGVGGMGTALGLARAFGLDPSSSVGFFASASRTGADRGDQRKFAAMIAEAVTSSGFAGMGGDFMKAVQNFSETAARMGLTTPNSGAYASALSGLMQISGGKLDAAGAANLLGAADSNMRGGGSGMFGQSFMMQALSRGTQGLTDPFMISALEQQGIFGTTADTFAKDSPLRKMMAAFGAGNFPALSSTTNLDKMMAEFDKQYAGSGSVAPAALMQALGLPTMAQASEMWLLHKQSPGGMGAMSALLKRNGINLGDVNPSGLGEISGIAGAKDFDSLNAYGDQMLSGGQLSGDEQTRLRTAMSGSSMGALKDTLVQLVAKHGQVENDATSMRRLVAGVDNLETLLGEKIASPLAGILTAVNKLAGITADAGPMAMPDADMTSYTDAMTGAEGGAAFMNWNGGAAGAVKDIVARMGGGLDGMFSRMGALGPLAKAVGWEESGLDNLAHNKTPGSTATGLFQFTDPAWKDYGGGNRYSPEDQMRAFAREIAAFRAKGATTDEEFAMGHHYGIAHLFDKPDAMAQREASEARMIGEIYVHFTDASGKVVQTQRATLQQKPGAAYAPTGAPAAPGAVP
ncbi:MAG: hypothetical protein ACLQJR_05710 [Stellaceae bacterium]